MTTLALPRLRRFRRPPARVVYCALELTVDLLFVMYWAVTLARPGGALPVPIKVLLLALSAVAAALSQRKLREVWAAWRDDRPIAKAHVRRWEWAVEGVCLVWLLLAIPSVLSVRGWWR